MKYARLAFIATLLFISQLCFADNYPRNYAIDIQHYSFALTLSDNSDEIIGETTIQVLFKTGDSKRLRLDFINRTPDRGGKGMIVEAVIYENNPITFEHQKDTASFLSIRQRAFCFNEAGTARHRQRYGRLTTWWIRASSKEFWWSARSPSCIQHGKPTFLRPQCTAVVA